MTRKPTLVSLFSGAGGLDLGLEQAGFETLLANEIEPHACETLRSNQVLQSLRLEDFDQWFECCVISQRCYKSIDLSQKSNLRTRLLSGLDNSQNYLNRAKIIESDIRNITSKDILDITSLKAGELDLMAGGPPCQPFSRAGKREMTNSSDGQLFLEYVRLVNEVRPKWVLFENVKGLVINKADVCRSVCSKCGFKSLPPFSKREEWRDATETVAGCSQCNGDHVHEIIWDKVRSGSLEVIEAEFSRIGYQVRSKVLNAVDFGAPQHRERLFIIASRDGESFDWPEATHVSKNKPVNPTLFDSNISVKKHHISLYDALYKNGHWQYGNLDRAKAVLWVKNVVRPHDEPVTWSLDRITPTIGAHQAAKLAIAPYGVPEAQLARQQWHILGRRQGDTPPVFVEHEYLQDNELMAIQTFPKSWYIHGTRMQRAFQIGNAVPPILAHAVGRSIIEMIATEVKNDIFEKRDYVEHNGSSIHA